MDGAVVDAARKLQRPQISREPNHDDAPACGQHGLESRLPTAGVGIAESFTGSNTVHKCVGETIGGPLHKTKSVRLQKRTSEVENSVNKRQETSRHS